MNWIPLADLAQLEAIDQASRSKPVLIFKHSTRCSISTAALDRLERAWTPADDAAHSAYYLELLRYRALSDAIAQRYGVRHESPQVLVVRGGRAVHDASHFAITYAGTLQALNT